MIQSEDQGEEILSSCVVDGKLVVGSEKGVLRIWQVGSWDDSEQIAMVGKGASADVLAAVRESPMVAVGMDDGCVRFVDMGRKRPKVLHETEVKHDELEGALGLGFDIGGRMISGGGQIVKVWEDSHEADDGEEEDNEEDSLGVTNGRRVSGFGSDEDGSEEDGDESSGEEQRQKKKQKKKKKKRKRRGKDESGRQQDIVGFRGMD